MLLYSIFAAGALALQASAFLVPLEVAHTAEIAQHDKELKHKVLELDCQNCPFAGPDGDGSIWAQDDSPVNIHLEFDVTDDDQFLQINGQPVFPPPQTLIPITLKASQIRTSDQSQTGPLRLGYALEILPTVTEVTDISLTTVQLTILDIQGIPVKVDTVKIDVVQSWGHTHIARITRIPYSQSPGTDQCVTSICRLRAIIADRLGKMIDAAKAHASKAKGWFKNGCWGRKHAQENAKQGQKRPHHHAHHRHGGFRHFMKQTFHFVVLPAMLGVSFGLAVCVIGMVIGQTLARCVKRPRRADAEIPVEEDEKDALMETGEMPPQYEDVDVVVVEQK